MDSDCPKLVVEELPPDEKDACVDDAVSIKSYDAKDIAVDCGWKKDVSGSPMDAYNSMDGNFGWFPGSVDGDAKMKNPSKTVFERFSACDEPSTFDKQLYSVKENVSYTIISTPAGKLIRIGNKIIPLKMFLNFDCIEQSPLGFGQVQCYNRLDSKHVHSFNIPIDDLVDILLHAACNNMHSSCYASQHAYVQC